MENKRKVIELNLDDVLPNRFQPRIKFDEKAINELAGSIKEYGVIQPILVREIGDKYEIIAGERRYKASALAGKQTIPAIISNLNDRDSAEVALIENIQRKDLTPIEEAISYKKILDMGYLNQEELADKLDKTQSTISNKLRLLNLDEEVQEALLNNQISERHARSLLRLENSMEQKEMLQRIIEERLPVRKTDIEIDKILNIESYTADYSSEKIENDIPDEKVDIFNIPSSPIIESFDEIEIFDDFNNNETNFKPGFLDIDRIEQTAEEINTEQPLADIQKLLESDNNTINNEIYEGVEEKEENNNIIHGKFFSFVDDNKNNELVTEQTDNDNKTNLNELNSDFITDIKSEEVSSTFEPDYNFDFTPSDVETDKLLFGNNDVVDYSIPGVDDIEYGEKTITLNNAITEARNFGQTLEKMGFEIEIEELDLMDIYEIKFKIKK